MAVTEFDIDGVIGDWGYSNTYVKSYLKAAGANPVVCHVCSLGGDFLMSMNIKDEFSKHGNVTVDISGYAASAATVVALGAVHTRISDSSFYLIHKVMSYVEAWGKMNEDDIRVVIENLEKIKDENEKMTLVAAKAYAEKSGKPVTDILNLMKEEKWLTADEAKEWGFVDEVYKATGKLNVAAMSTKLNMLGLPVLPVGRVNKAQDNFVSKIVEGIRTLVVTEHKEPEGEPDLGDNHINKNRRTMKIFEKLNVVLAVPSLESEDGKGVYLNEAQMQAVETALSDRDAKVAAYQKHETNYNDAVAKLNALHPDVSAAENLEAKLAVVSAKLAAKPGVTPSGAKEKKTEEENDGVDWEKLNSLPHMKENAGELV